MTTSDYTQIVATSPGVTPRQAVQSVLIIGGCNCNPDITIATDQHGMKHYSCGHDDDCPMYDWLEAAAR